MGVALRMSHDTEGPNPAPSTTTTRPGADGEAKQKKKTPPEQELSEPLHHGHGELHGKKLWGMALLALGVVYGDIGTSPLYTMKECMHALVHGGTGQIVRADVLEVLSLIFWSMTMVVSVKYVIFVLKADNKGEGGMFAMLAMLPERLRGGPVMPLTVTGVLACIGAALLYGDGAITPAISVLSAAEGVTVARPDLARFVIPATVVILLFIFGIQSRGTKVIGQLFGPVMVVWFTTLAGLGIWHILKEPSVLEALSPHHAVGYFVEHRFNGILILGSVVLCITGGEALYADMGHFGRKPVRRAWLYFVMPSLVLNYFGQGALLLRDPSAASNPFFAMVPTGNATFVLVGLSGIATVIASQAMISGAFSVTKQAMQLGFFPRVTVRHTDKEQEGQIYIPEIAVFLAATCITLVLVFKQSERLAAAYGIAVMGTMNITSIIYFLVNVHTKKWPVWKAGALLCLFLAFDIPFLAANVIKFWDGGYVPVLIGIAFVVTMLIWHEGRRIIAELYFERFSRFEDTWPDLEKEIAQRTPGTGIFMAVSDKGLPPILAHHVKRTRALHKQIMLLTVVTADVPEVQKKDRITVDEMGHGFHRVHVYFGFMEQPDLPRALNLLRVRETLDFDLEDITYYLAREHLLGGPGGKMGTITEKYFGFLQRNAVNVDRYFRIPPEQVIEVGTQIDL